VPEPAPSTLTEDLTGWMKASGNLVSGVWPNQDAKRLWYKLKDQDDEWDWWAKRNESITQKVVERQEDVSWEYGETITEVDVIYGDDEPFLGFERVEGGKVVEAKEGKWESVGLAYKRGSYCQSSIVVPGN
jgi:hypothetical protein